MTCVITYSRISKILKFWNASKFIRAWEKTGGAVNKQ